MLGVNVWRRVLGVDRATVIEEIDFDEESDTVVVHVRLRRPTKRRCGRCGVGAPGYDQGEGRRNWRAIDLGTMKCFLQAETPRVNCPEHGPTVAQVPGPATVPVTPGSSTTRWPGWSPTPPSRRSVS